MGSLENEKMEKDKTQKMFFAVENDGISLHLNKIVKSNGVEYTVFDLKYYCQSIYNAAIEWLRANENSQKFKDNYVKYFKYHRQSLPWNNEGVLVIAEF